MAKLARLPAFDALDRGAADAPRVPRLRTRYYAFLSYSHKDKELADWLHRELEKFRVPQRAGRQADGQRRRSAAADADLPRPAGSVGRRRSRRGDQGRARRVAIPGRAVLADRRQVALDQRGDRELQADPAGRLRARRGRRRRAVRQRHSRAAKTKNASRPRCATNMTGAATRRPSGPSRWPPIFAKAGEGQRLAFLKLVAGNARSRPRRARAARTDAASPAHRVARRRLARRNGGDQHARGHRVPGAQRSARAAPRGGRAGRVHARRPQGQARADRQARRARRRRRARACLLQQAGCVAS